MSHDSPLRRAIDVLTIPVLRERLRLPGRVTANCCVCSPLPDDDRSPSFSIYANGTRWKDHGTGMGGDSFDLFCAVKGLNPKQGWSAFIDLARS